MKPLFAVVIVCLLTAVCGAQAPIAATETVVVLPFENTSKAPGLEWIGESFPEIVGQQIGMQQMSAQGSGQPGSAQRMAASSLFVVPRSQRVYAFDRLGIPASARPSLATLLRLGEEMDVDFLVVGRYTYDGQLFTATAQLLDMKNLRLSPEVKGSGPLTKLLELERGLTWDLLRLMNPNQLTSRNVFVASGSFVRLDALEKYIRGVIATDRPERLRNLREAVRLNQAYTPAVLQLARTYYGARDYANAIAWFGRIPLADPAAREAQFFLGMAAYYTGDYARAQAAFDFVATRMPLTEVYNNLGVIAGRRGLKTATDHFERATQADPGDADYHFNYAVALYRAGDAAAAAKQLRRALELRPADAEAKGFLERVSAGSLPTPQPDAAKAAPVPKLPLERIKSNYDEASFRQLALEIENLNEERMTERGPHSHTAFHVQHGRQMLAENFLTVAEKDFREAAVLEPANAGAHAGLARVYELNGDAARARAEAQSAIRLQPGADAFLVLARLDLRDNKPETAAESVEKALQLEPTDPAAQALKTAIAAKLAEKAQPLPNR
ncbi:MAG: tetratricopeptide repeat protein [Candidatus Koribacter versatilis]|uniref:Tetratricopeptide repeat protein n=1 Tax=Candidatus Korobacter versatilis TaxID=658062 RepID=A0A932A6R6_9BACT|nr:tetratricopeptide repeat protein [Candidatus Koribacter versatilis]